MPEAFQVFDPSGSGHVDMKERRHIVSHLVLHVFHALFPLAASEDARGNPGIIGHCEEIMLKSEGLTMLD